jgi:hypothetical protein
VSRSILSISRLFTYAVSVMSPHATLLSYSSPENIKDLRDQAALISMLWREKESEIRSQSSKAALSWPQPRSEFATDDESIIPEGTLETLTVEFDKVNIIVRAVQPRLLLVLIGGIAPNPKSTQLKITVEKRGDPRYPKAPTVVRPATSSVTKSNGSRQDSPHSDLLGQPADASKKAGAEVMSLADSAVSSQKDKKSGAPIKESSPPRSESETPRIEPANPNQDPAGGSTNSSINKFAEEAIEARENKKPSEIDDDVKLGLLHIQRKKVDYATEYMRDDFRAKGFVMPHQDIIP